jgi:broad specificity phosphatase PhoE
MPTRAVLIEAGPTPWDIEGRIVGSASLPLTAEAMDAIRHRVDSLAHPLSSVYRAAANEACDQASKIIAQKFRLRPRKQSELEELHLGLWQGLSPEVVRTRFPTVYRQWEEQPLAVTPPEGEPLEAAIIRIRTALGQILRRNKGLTVGLTLRPMALQIAAGVLTGQTPPQIAACLRQRLAMETIEIDEAGVKALLD